MIDFRAEKAGELRALAETLRAQAEGTPLSTYKAKMLQTVSHLLEAADALEGPQLTAAASN